MKNAVARIGRIALSRRRAALFATLAVTLPLIVATTASGHRSTDLSLVSGAVWLMSPKQGLVTLIDGPSNSLVTVARGPWDLGADLAVTQTGASAIVADSSAGTLTRLDGSTFEVSRPVRFADPQSNLSVIDAGDKAFVVDAGGARASVINPATLALTRSPFPMAAHPGPGQTLVDTGGRLWVIDADGSGLNWYDSDGTHGQVAADPDATLAEVNNQPGIVDTGTAQPPISWLGTDGARSAWDCRLETPAGGGLQLLGAASDNRIFAAVSDSATLVTASESGDTCAATANLGTHGDHFGAMVQSGNYLFIPNTTTGTIAVIDISDPSTVQQSLPLTTPGNNVELVAKDGLVFYNDLDSEISGVLTFSSGQWTSGAPIQKYNPNNPAADIVAPATQPVEPTMDQPRDPQSEQAQGTTRGQSQDSSTLQSQATGVNVSAAATNGGRAPLAGSGGGAVPSGRGSASAGGSGGSVTATSTTNTDASSTSQTPTTTVFVPPDRLVVTDIAISSELGSLPDGSYSTADQLTFSPTITGGEATSYAWTADYLGSDGSTAKTSTDARPTFTVDSGGSSYEDWAVSLVVTNAAGTSQPKQLQFRVSYDRPQVTSVTVSPNPAVTTRPVSASVIIEGPYRSCTWTVNNASAPCDQSIDAPADPGDYAVDVSVEPPTGPMVTAAGPSLLVHNDCTDVNSGIQVLTSDPIAGQPVQFDLTGNAPFNAQSTWSVTPANPQMDFSASQNNVWTPAAPGVYTVSASAVIPQWGCPSTNTVSTDVAVRAPDPPPDTTPPVFGAPVITENPRSGSVTVSASDPESGIGSLSLTVQFVWVNQCTNQPRANPPAPVSGVRSGDSTTAQFSGGSQLFCVDPNDPAKQRQGDELIIASWDASATNGEGLSTPLSG